MLININIVSKCHCSANTRRWRWFLDNMFEDAFNMNRSVVMHAKSNLNIDLYKSRKNIFDTPLCTLPPHAHGHTNTGIHHKKYLKDIDRINKTTLLKCVKSFDLIDFVEYLCIKHNMDIITINFTVLHFICNIFLFHIHVLWRLWNDSY